MVNLKMLLWITLSTMLSFIATANQLRYSPDELYRPGQTTNLQELFSSTETFFSGDQGPFTVDLAVTTAVVAVTLGLFTTRHKFRPLQHPIRHQQRSSGQRLHRRSQA